MFVFKLWRDDLGGRSTDPPPLLYLIFEILEIYITGIGLHSPKLGSEREMMCKACWTADTPFPVEKLPWFTRYYNTCFLLCHMECHVSNLIIFWFCRYWWYSRKHQILEKSAGFGYQQQSPHKVSLFCQRFHCCCDVEGTQWTLTPDSSHGVCAMSTSQGVVSSLGPVSSELRCNKAG